MSETNGFFEPVALISELRLIRNYRTICERAGTAVLAVIKANGYGHGAVHSAQILEKAGCPWFAVARFSEALELRQGGITAPILILGRIAADKAPQAAELGIHVALFSDEQLEQYAEAIRARQTAQPDCPVKLSVHIKVDSGMSRLGQTVENAESFLLSARSRPEFEVSGLFTHLATADSDDLSAANAQLDRFEALVEALTVKGLRPPLVHVSNSAAILRLERGNRYDLVRAGIALYGLAPSEACPVGAGIEPILSLKTRVISVKNLPRGAAVSYGGRYVVEVETEKIAVIALGYADGFRRMAGNRVLIRGVSCPVVGTVCMDQCMVHVPDELPVQEGDEVVVIGRQGEAQILVSEVAERWETIAYEVTCGLSPRVRRVYSED